MLTAIPPLPSQVPHQDSALHTSSTHRTRNVDFVRRHCVGLSGFNWKKTISPPAARTTQQSQLGRCLCNFQVRRYLTAVRWICFFTTAKCNPVTTSEPRQRDIGRQRQSEHSDTTSSYGHGRYELVDTDEHSDETASWQNDGLFLPPYQASSATHLTSSSHRLLIVALTAVCVLMHTSHFLFRTSLDITGVL